MYRRYGKRLLDLLGGTLLLTLTAPLLLAVALLVRWRLGTPVFFRQERLGRGGTPFLLVKFRTMTEQRDATGALLPDGERLTRLGWWLRRLSLDELPEVVQVLRGEMSLVGPRPLVARYRERYSADEWERHAVRPGLTGWAQVAGRNALSWEGKFACDRWYVAHCTLWLDLRILGRTLGGVVGGAGVSAVGEATMGEFRGTTPPSEEGARG